jgi:hypothetical protein
MSDLQRRILDTLRDGRRYRALELGELLGADANDVQRAMPELYADCWVHYSLTGGRIDGEILYSMGPGMIRGLSCGD